MSEQKSFDDIIQSVPIEKMLELYPHRSLQECASANDTIISPETQKFYLAYYARAAYEHVGFEQFSDENKLKFKKSIENIYAGIGGDKKQADFLKDLAQTAQYIEDRHFEVGNGNSEPCHGGMPRPDRTVGKNFIYRTAEERPESYRQEGYSELTSQTGERIPVWEIGTMKKGDEAILVVSIFDIAHRDNSYEAWRDFIEKFDELYLENKEKWDRGRIIIDVRGNRGGEDKPIDHVAKRLYGNLVNTYKRCEIKDTALSNHFLHQHGAYKPQNYEREGYTSDALIQRNHFSGQNQVLFDETQTFYPFNEERGYKGRIDILQCARVASSAESAYTSFYHHPNVRYIGENTHGMQQYVQGTFNTPWGGIMRVAWGKLTYWDKEGENIEVTGHKPDIDCSGQDAFDVALSIDRDQGRILGFRKKNEPIKGKEVYAEYDPKAESDPRKAYHARFIEPAIREVEQKNINMEHLRELKKQNIKKSPSVDARWQYFSLKEEK